MFYELEKQPTSDGLRFTIERIVNSILNRLCVEGWLQEVRLK